MNNARRKRIADIIKQLDALKDQVAELEELKSEIEELQTDEQVGFDNLPEGLQQADKGQRMEQAAESLGEAATQMDDLISSATEAIEEVLTPLRAASGEG